MKQWKKFEIMAFGITITIKSDIENFCVQNVLSRLPFVKRFCLEYALWSALSAFKAGAYRKRVPPEVFSFVFQLSTLHKIPKIAQFSFPDSYPHVGKVVTLHWPQGVIFRIDTKPRVRGSGKFLECCHMICIITRRFKPVRIDIDEKLIKG